MKELSQKISKSNYTFQKKGHKHQFSFNSGVQDSIATACNELGKLAEDPTDKSAWSKADACLDEGEKTLKKRQKHILITDQSDHGWGAVRHYEADPLVDNSDDEKEIKKANKAAQKEAEKAGYTSAKKRCGGGQGRFRNRHPQWMEQPGPSYRREVYQPPPPPLMGQYQFQNRPPPQYCNRLLVLGPCFSCGAYGHLAASCGAKECPYPLNQPVVSSGADVSEFIDQSTCGVCVDNVAAGSARGIECVDEATTKVSEHVTNGESVDSTEGNGMYDLHELESCSMHEVECSAVHNV